MKRFSILIVLLSFISTSTLLASGPGESSVKWLSLEEAVAKAQNEPKKIFIDVYTNWCGWCKKMDKATFSQEIISNQLNEDYYAVKLNAESTQAINIKGKSTTPKQIAKQFGVSAYPTTVYLDENQNLIQAVPGYQTVESLDMILNYFGEDNYKTTSWDEYQKSYKANN